MAALLHFAAVQITCIPQVKVLDFCAKERQIKDFYTASSSLGLLLVVAFILMMPIFTWGTTQQNCKNKLTCQSSLGAQLNNNVTSSVDAIALSYDEKL